MKKKYILIILIAVVIIGFFAYYIIDPSCIFHWCGGNGDCRALATSWCTSCKTAGWPDSTATTEAWSELQTCGGTYWTAPTWTDCSTARDFCNQCCGIIS